MKYQKFGVMLDCSRNAVMNVESLKKFIDCLAKMGYNTLELYMEDTFEVKDEPLFGYLRGRYTGEELKEVDAYAISRGIELIPAIQTLAHFTALDKRHYENIIDCTDILLIDEPKTYEFIENIFKSLAENFTSRNVNIGMDEAYLVGRGKYLDEHGYQDRTELLARHLSKVMKIAEKYGFKAHMWSDMFVRMGSGETYYDLNAKISPEIGEKIPSSVDLVYWDYYHTDKKIYDKMIENHQKLNCGLWFAGGAWTWNGFAPLSGFTLKSMRPAMASVRKHKIDKVIITMWGDNGAECSVFSQLHSLYAIRQFADGNLNMKNIRKGFYDIFGVKFADFEVLDVPNKMSAKDKQEKNNALAKTYFYMDPFMGEFDLNLSNSKIIPYESHAKLLKNKGKYASEFKYIFDELSALCKVLAVKTELGVKTRKVYKSGDKALLKALIIDYKKTIKLVENFHKEFRDLWFKENKPNGFEIQDARIGGLIMRLKTCIYRLEQYKNGKLNCIEELEQDIIEKDPNKIIGVNYYSQIISKSIM